MMEEWDIMERQKTIMDNQHMMRKYDTGQKQGNIRNHAAKCFKMLHEEMMKTYERLGSTRKLVGRSGGGSALKNQKPRIQTI